MDEKNALPIPEGAPRVTPPAAVKPKQIYAVDGKERVLLLLGWALAVLFVDLVLTGWGVPGLGVTLLVAAWYGVLFWYGGRRGLVNRESFVLFCAVCILALTFSLYSNQWFRRWNLIAITILMTVQLIAWSGAARHPWSSPVMLLERFYDLLAGCFGRLGAFTQSFASIKGMNHKRTRYMFGGLAVGILLLMVVIPMLMSADALFHLITQRAVNWAVVHVGAWLVRLLVGLLLAPFCFGLLYSLRHPKQGQKLSCKAISLEAAAPITVLVVMDAVYLFFLAVQFYALFGGKAYLAASGISFAEYARSGFFQLVAVAAINLTLVLSCVQLCRKGGRGCGVVKVLSTLLVAMSAVMLGSAVFRMSLYVAEYGLSFKRFLTYWGMALLVLFFAAAVLKIWKRDFAFFRVLFTVSVAGWLILNLINVDVLITKCNIAWGLSPFAVVSAAVDAQGWVNDASLPAMRAYADAHPEEQWLDVLVTSSQSEAAERSDSWENWSVAAQMAAGA